MDFAYADSVDLFGIFLAIGGVFAPPDPLAYWPALHYYRPTAALQPMRAGVGSSRHTTSNVLFATFNTMMMMMMMIVATGRWPVHAFTGPQSATRQHLRAPALIAPGPATMLGLHCDGAAVGGGQNTVCKVVGLTSEIYTKARRCIYEYSVDFALETADFADFVN